VGWDLISVCVLIMPSCLLHAYIDKHMQMPSSGASRYDYCRLLGFHVIIFMFRLLAEFVATAILTVGALWFVFLGYSNLFPNSCKKTYTLDRNMRNAVHS
jgi:hypothetical protein